MTGAHWHRHRIPAASRLKHRTSRASVDAMQHSFACARGLSSALNLGLQDIQVMPFAVLQYPVAPGLHQAQSCETSLHSLLLLPQSPNPQPYRPPE